MTKSKLALEPLEQKLTLQEHYQQRQQQHHQKQSRKSVWTRDKVARLISLYRQNECLWNNYTEAYKNKDKRHRAIEDICTRLRISKLDFGKKIHNLRNQFNSEMKKIERRMEESVGSGGGGEREEIRSRWDHYESLLFLKDVIAPRPGYQISRNWNHHRNHQKAIKNQQQQSSDEDDAGSSHIRDVTSTGDYDEAEDTGEVSQENDPIGEESEYHYEETALDEETELVDQESATDEYMTSQGDVVEPSNDTVDQKYNPPAAMREVIITSLPENVNSRNKAYFATTIRHNSSGPCDQFTKGRQLELKPKAFSATSTPQNGRPVIKPSCSPAMSPSNASIDLNKSAIQRFSDTFETSSFNARRDEWDAFGEMVAAEFRNLNTDQSRKKLKRKIMQAMLEVGEADDGISISIPLN